MKSYTLQNHKSMDQLRTVLATHTKLLEQAFVATNSVFHTMEAKWMANNEAQLKRRKKESPRWNALTMSEHRFVIRLIEARVLLWKLGHLHIVEMDDGFVVSEEDYAPGVFEVHGFHPFFTALLIESAEDTNCVSTKSVFRSDVT
ncbi:hypothetical protein OXX80_006390 [Metschnikowia pulcherrima]